MDVQNNTLREISVSINHWGKDGSTDWFSISPGGSESWDRSDDRGFVMAVRQDGQEKPYYIFASSSVIVYDNYVMDDSRVISPATDRYQ